MRKIDFAVLAMALAVLLMVAAESLALI